MSDQATKRALPETESPPIEEKPVRYGRMGFSFGIFREDLDNWKFNQEHAAEIAAAKLAKQQQSASEPVKEASPASAAVKLPLPGKKGNPVRYEP